MAGRLGARYLELTYRPWEYFDKVDPVTIPAGCQFFVLTGHSLCEPYLSYWRAHGGLARERRGHRLWMRFPHGRASDDVGNTER